MDACLNKSTIGKDRYVCGVAFKDHTWCTYSMDDTDIEAQGLLRKYFDDRIKMVTGSTRTLPLLRPTKSW